MNKLLLLHGAIGSSSQLEPLAEKLKDNFEIYLWNFTGHGGKEIPAVPFSIKLFAEDVMHFIDKNKLSGIDVYGYSMGGYVAMYIAGNFPGKIGKIFTTATKFKWEPETSLKESKLLNTEKIIEKIPAFAKELETRHSPQNWITVLNKTSEMMMDLGIEPELKISDLEFIENEVLLSVGDRDNMVSIEETVDVYRKLKKGSLLVIPDTPHPIEKINSDRLTSEIVNFFI
ncbi:MAG TPA: alpha/beta hydrolase [Ignavibacteria bacterium]|nr:alpha/beta hydrolase [Ignavibacteria bacterium]HMR39588.1 alpha/beta hydrolase [Ignavibacteria bacterium]